jgi:hypothetical protein
LVSRPRNALWRSHAILVQRCANRKPACSLGNRLSHCQFAL